MVAVGGFAVAVAAVQFIRAGTHLEPYKPALALVSTGIYRYSRNPIYVGFSFIFTGAALLLGNTWLLLLLLPTLLTVHFGVVRREEEYLLGKFGAAYRAYQSQVRRWL
jgi:protein-S-isoprenylcysteine O-methyltransferase Ste14